MFLGLHLLITDPSTSPRTPLGRLAFGVLYGVGVFVLYGVLGALGLPTFYDKLLCVPLLNLSVPLIDRGVAALGERTWLDRLGLSGPLGGFNLAHMGVWAVLFTALALTGRADGRHPGDSLPFWMRACEAGRTGACERLIQLETTYCGDNSGWACNELGVHLLEGRITSADPARARESFARACEARYQPGCLNVLASSPAVRTDPRPLDLRLLLREGGRNLIALSEPDLDARACDHGWAFACGAGTQVAGR
ncbi:MAG: hypothetical protein R2712_18140 [Vicinamibacterales bacterium]